MGTGFALCDSQIALMSEHSKRAFELLLARDYEKAWLTLVDQAPETPAIKALKGQALAGMGEAESARVYFDDAIREDPDCAEAIAGRGHLCLTLGDVTQAEHDLHLAVKLQPSVARFHGWRGELLAQQGRLEECLKSLETAYRLGDRTPAHLLTRARLHATHGRHEQAQEMLVLAQKNGADPCNLEWTRATVSLQAGKPEQALRQFQLALKYDPGRPKLWLAYLRATEEHQRSALLARLEMALGQHPDHEKLLGLAATLYLEVGQPEAGIPLLREAQLRNPESPYLLTQLGHLLRASGSRVQAAALYERALELNPIFPEAWYGKGLLSQSEQAAVCFRKAISRNPRPPLYHLELGRVLNRMGQYEAACQPLQTAANSMENSKDAQRELGRALCATERYETALVALDKAVSLGDDSPDTQLRRGHCLGRLGQFSQALEAYEAAEAGGCDGADLVYGRARALGYLERNEEAETLLRRLTETEATSGRAWYELGALYLRQGSTEQAEEAYQKACQLEPAYASHPLTPAPGDECPLGERVERALSTFQTLLPILSRDPLWSQLDEESFSDLGGLYSLGLVWLYREERAPELEFPDADEAEQGLLEDLSQFKTRCQQPARDSFILWLRSALLEPAQVSRNHKGLAHYLSSALDYLGRGEQPTTRTRQEWRAREKELQELVHKLGPGVEYALELKSGSYRLLRDGKPLKEADCVVLGLFTQEQQFFPGWACWDVPEPARVAPVMGVPGQFSQKLSEEEAAAVVSRCAERLRVQTILTFPGEEAVMFVGLGSLRSVGVKKENA